MNKILLKVIGLTYTESQSKAYVLILGKSGTKKRIPILIGNFEAQAIAMKMENIKPQRPITHDLFVSIAEAFDFILEEILITDFNKGVFFSKLYFKTKNKDQYVIIDSRTSDAVALALRFNCPIYCDEKVFKDTSIYIDFDPKTDTQEESKKTKKEDETEKSPIDSMIREYMEELENIEKDIDDDNEDNAEDDTDKDEKTNKNTIIDNFFNQSLEDIINLLDKNLTTKANNPHLEEIFVLKKLLQSAIDKEEYEQAAIFHKKIIQKINSFNKRYK